MRRYLIKIVFAGLALLALASPAWAQTTIGPIIVGSNGDDGFEDSSGTGNSTGNTIGPIDQTNEWGFWRFTGITIDAGATITDAYITFAIDSGGQDEPDVTIYGVDASAPSTPSWGSNSVSGLSRTTASVDWGSTDLTCCTPNPQDFNTAALTAIVQELVDSYSYSSGVMAFVATSRANLDLRDLSVIGRDNATYGATRAARLTITYTTGGGGGTLCTSTLLGVGKC